MPLNDREYQEAFLGEIIPGQEPKLVGDNIIPVCEPDIDPKVKEYVNEAIDSTWISSRGKYIGLFEQEFAEKVGAKYAVAVNSGTSALHLAMAAIDLRHGDEVIVPTFTMISTAYAVSYMGATPIFVDCDEYYQMDVEEVKKAITSKTKLILPVHIYGHPVDMDAIEALGIPVIYDACEAHGALYKGEKIGGRGLASCYSFYANKILTTGEGGMFATNDEQLAKQARNMKDVSFSTERHFWHKKIGFNYRMTNICAAIGYAQVQRFDELVAAHIFNAEEYIYNLKDVPGLTMPKVAPWADHVFWMFGIEVDADEFGMSRDELRTYLADRGIETRTFFVPMHLQPYYYQGRRVMPNAERLSERGMYLPSSSKLTIEQHERVCSTIKKAYDEFH